MHKNKNGLLMIVLLFITGCLLFFPPFAFSRGFRGGSFGRRGSWGSRKSSSRSSFSRKSAWGRKKSKTAFSGKRPLSNSKQHKADRALASKAKASGTLFKNRKSALEHFKTNNGQKYTSKYSVKPRTRPAHIPETNEVNGQKVRIEYNPTFGGYGYNRGGSWAAYNVFSDLSMLNLLMRRNSYYYGGIGYGGYGYRRIASTWLPGMSVVFILFFVAAVLRFLP